VTIQIHNPHDAIFKKFFSNIEIAKDFIEAYLPEQLKQNCNFATLKIEAGSFVDEDLKQHHSDILYSLKIGGIKGYVYINVEHQSTPQEFMSFRMLRYKLAIMKQHLDQGNKKLPAVIPMFFYHGKQSPYPYSLKIIDCFEDKEFAKNYFFKDPFLVDISLTPDEEIYKHKKLGLLEMVQKHIFTRDLVSIAKDIVKLVKSTQPGHELFSSLVYYSLIQGDTPDVNKVIETLKTIENYREDVMNAAQQLKQQGLQQGLQQGRQEILALVRNLLKQNVPLATIKSASGLSEQELLELEDA